jgi:hypothetical protein
MPLSAAPATISPSAHNSLSCAAESICNLPGAQAAHQASPIRTSVWLLRDSLISSPSLGPTRQVRLGHYVILSKSR